MHTAFTTPVTPLPRRPRQHHNHCALCSPLPTPPPTPPSDRVVLPSSMSWQIAQPERVVLRSSTHDSDLLAAAHTLSHSRELSTHIALLRRHKLALLLDDVACHLRSASLRHIATRANKLGSDMLSIGADASDSAARADARKLLWEARVALAPLSPPAATPRALERARGALLDVATATQVPSADTLRAELYALLVENTLLEELRSLRVLERAVRAAARNDNSGTALAPALSSLRAAAAALGIDNYRVRGKARLAAAVLRVRSAAGSALAPVCERLHDALIISLETDLAARRPHGAAMLLRPAMHDIPNFEVVDSHLLRGGQPTAAGTAWLTDYGVSHYVDLRGSDRGNQWSVETAVAGSGAVVNLAIEDFSTPSTQQVLDFIALMDQVRECGSVAFVHCKAGIGRTGVMVSCWRIYHGDTVDVALRKERLYSADGGGLKQEQFVRDFACYCQRGER